MPINEWTVGVAVLVVTLVVIFGFSRLKTVMSGKPKSQV